MDKENKIASTFKIALMTVIALYITASVFVSIAAVLIYSMDKC